MTSTFLPGFYRTLAARLDELERAAETPEIQADLAIQAVRLAALVAANDRDAIGRKFDDAKARVDAVGDPKERDYLRRILLEAARDAFPNPAEESALDALLDQIDDPDERQNALYSRCLTLAKALLRAKDYAATREALAEKIEEIEDLRPYEEVLARIRAADAIEGYRSDDEEPLQTVAGRALLDDGAIVEFLADQPPERVAYFSRPALDDFLTFLKEKAREINSDALDDDERAETREELRTFVLRSPEFLARREEFRPVLKECDAFAAVVGAIRLALAQPSKDADALRADLELAATLADADPKRLVALVDAILTSSENAGAVPAAKDATRKAIAVMMKDAAKRRVDAWTTLVRAHAIAGMTEPARRLATLAKEQIDALDPAPTRAFHKRRAFPTLVASLDRDAVDAWIAEEKDAKLAAELTSERDAFRAVADNANDRLATDAALNDIFVKALEQTRGDDPLLAADALMRLAEVAAEFLNIGAEKTS